MMSLYNQRAVNRCVTRLASKRCISTEIRRNRKFSTASPELAEIFPPMLLKSR